MRIESAITTCTRNGVSYLEGTLKSLEAAGFDPQIVRDEIRAGSWPTLREALRRLLATPGDALIVFQDDIQIAAGCREWLETQLWPGPDDKIGVVSLYLPSVSSLRPGWFTTDDTAIARPWGACGLVFPRHFAQRILDDPTNKAFLCGSDTSIATACKRDGLQWWVHQPSLIQHIGATSAIHDNLVGLDENRVAASDWCRDVADLTSPE